MLIVNDGKQEYKIITYATPDEAGQENIKINNMYVTVGSKDNPNATPLYFKKNQESAKQYFLTKAEVKLIKLELAGTIQYFPKGTEIFLGNYIVERPYYLFIGWCPRADGWGAWYDPNSKIILTEDIKLFPQYEYKGPQFKPL